MPSEKQKFTAHEKAAILKEHLIKGVSVSKISDKYGVSPSTVYGWRRKLLDEAPLTFGAASIETDAEPPAPHDPHLDNGKSYTNWADVPSPLPPDFDVTRLPPLVPVEIQELMAAVAVPFNPSDEEWQKATIRWADPHKSFLEVTLPEPYLKIPDPDLNELGLPHKEFYTTGDLCRLLDLHPDTFRYRLRSGIYPEAKTRSGDKRRFTLEDAAEIVRITRAMPKSRYHPRKR